MSRLRNQWWPLLHGAISVAAVVLLLSGHSQTGRQFVGPSLWWLAWLTLAASMLLSGRRWSLTDATGTWLPSRVILLVGVAGPLMTYDLRLESRAWVTIGIAIVAVRATVIIRGLGASDRIRLGNVAGVVQADHRRFRGAVATVDLLTPAVLFGCAMLGLPGEVWIAFATIDLLVVVVAVTTWWVVRGQPDPGPDELRATVDRIAPKFILYWDAPKSTVFQIAMWLPYLRRIGFSFVILVRTPAAFSQAMSVADGIPVVMVRRRSDLDDALPSTASTVFYVNNAATNSQLVAHIELTHVQLLHGDSDKAPSWNPVTAMYDRIYVAGQAGIDRYIDHGVSIPPEKFEIVGRPQVDQVVVATERTTQAAPVVLYTPTWRGYFADSEYSSLPKAHLLFDQLLARNCAIVFRPHPYCYKDREFRKVMAELRDRLDEHSRRTGVIHLHSQMAEKDMTVFDCFNASDLMISDVSSVVADYLCSEKPFAVMTDLDEDSFVAQFPLARAAYVMGSDDRTWSASLDAMLGDDPMRDRRRELKVHYLGGFDHEHYADAFVDAARAEVRGARPAASAEVDDSEQVTEVVIETADAPESHARLPEIGRIFHAGLCATGSLLMLAGHLWSGLALWVVAWFYMAQRTASVGRRRGFNERLGSWTTVRLILAAGLAGPLLHGPLIGNPMTPGTPEAWLTWIGWGLVIIAIPAEAIVRRAGRYRGLLTANVSQGGAAEASGRLSAAVAVVEFLAAPILLVLGLAGINGWPWVAVLLPSTLLALVIGLRAHRRRARTRAADTWVPELMAELRPEFVLYWDGIRGNADQVGMWIPYLKRIGRPFFVMVRTPSTFREVVRVCEDVPVILCRTIPDLDRCITDSITTIFYVNHGSKNAHAVRYAELTHVQLMHGDNERPANFNPVTAMYDKIFVAGQAAIDRYTAHGVDIPLDRFEIVGRPQLAGIDGPQGQGGSPHVPCVFYRPGLCVSSLPQGLELVSDLLERGCSILFRPHPAARRSAELGGQVRKIERLLADHAARTGIAHVHGDIADQMTRFECYNAADAMITDGVGAVAEFLFADKPVAVMTNGRSAEEIVDAAPAAEAAHLLGSSRDQWAEALTDLLGGDGLRSRRATLRRYFYGPFDRAGYADVFVDTAREVVLARARSATIT